MDHCKKGIEARCLKTNQNVWFFSKFGFGRSVLENETFFVDLQKLCKVWLESWFPERFNFSLYFLKLWRDDKGGYRMANSVPKPPKSRKSNSLFQNRSCRMIVVVFSIKGLPSDAEGLAAKSQLHWSVLNGEWTSRWICAISLIIGILKTPPHLENCPHPSFYSRTSTFTSYMQNYSLAGTL